MYSTLHRHQGFTLIELVMVIVLMAVVSVVSVQFVASSTSTAIDSSQRQQRALAAVVISQHISRELREALPDSVRTSGSCVEWIPIVAGSVYTSLPIAGADTGFSAVALPASQSAAGRIAIYGYGQDYYQLTNPGPISPPATIPAGSGAVNVSFNGGASHRFTAASPRNRFFVLADPVTLCQAGQFLYRYSGYGYQSTIGTGLPAAMPDRQVLASGLVPGSVDFRITPASLMRNGLVGFSFQLQNTGGDEVLSVSQKVQIRNVP